MLWYSKTRTCWQVLNSSLGKYPYERAFSLFVSNINVKFNWTVLTVGLGMWDWRIRPAWIWWSGKHYSDTYNKLCCAYGANTWHDDRPECINSRWNANCSRKEWTEQCYFLKRFSRRSWAGTGGDISLYVFLFLFRWIEIGAAKFIFEKVKCGKQERRIHDHSIKLPRSYTNLERSKHVAGSFDLPIYLQINYTHISGFRHFLALFTGTLFQRSCFSHDLQARGQSSGYQTRRSWYKLQANFMLITHYYDNLWAESTIPRMSNSTWNSWVHARHRTLPYTTFCSREVPLANNYLAVSICDPGSSNQNGNMRMIEHGTTAK